MQQILEWIQHFQYIGVFVIQSLGVLGVPIPDDSTLVLLGYLVHKKMLRLEFTMLAAFLGIACGSTISFSLGRVFGILVLSHYGARVGITPDKIEKTHAWFRRLGKWLLTIGFFIPGVRHVMSYLAGASKLEYPVFALFAYTGGLIWSMTFIYAGLLLGDSWEIIIKEWEHFLMPAVLIILGVGLAGYLVWMYAAKARKNKRKENSQSD